MCINLENVNGKTRPMLTQANTLTQSQSYRHIGVVVLLLKNRMRNCLNPFSLTSSDLWFHKPFFTFLKVKQNRN